MSWNNNGNNGSRDPWGGKDGPPDIDEALKISNKLIVLNGDPAKIVTEISINKKSNLANLKIKIKELLKRNE